MTQEEKDLLLKDLCARLPYGVKINVNGEEDTLLELGVDTGWVNASYDIKEVRSYLRPMSSMTEEEKEELKQEHFKDERLFAECLIKMKNGDSSMRGKVIPHFTSDWCNKNHFDYRGLIEKGLALEAPEGMYK